MEPEATYQQQAEQDARAGILADGLRHLRAAWFVSPAEAKAVLADRQRLLDALAVAERERDQAREALQLIAVGSWNFGNARLGMTVMDFARESIAGGPQA